MARLLLAILAFGAALALIKMIIVAVVIAGLIFRTKVTLFLLFVGGMLTLIAAAPLLGLGIVAAAIVYGIVKAAKSAEKDKEVLAIDDAEQE